MNTDTFEFSTHDGRRVRITIDRKELASTMLFRLSKTRTSYKGNKTQPKKVVALEGGVKAEWL